MFIISDPLFAAALPPAISSAGRKYEQRSGDRGCGKVSPPCPPPPATHFSTLTGKVVLDTLVREKQEQAERKEAHHTGSDSHLLQSPQPVKQFEGINGGGGLD